MTVMLWICVALAAGCAALFLVARYQKKRAEAEAARADRAEAEGNALHEAIQVAIKKAERLQIMAAQQVKVEEKADAERREVAATPDKELVHRANALFGSGGGVPEQQREPGNPAA